MNDPTEPDSVVNPYAAHSQPSVQAVAVALRPTGVTVISVLCIVGGIMGFLAGLMQLGQQLVQGFVMSSLQPGKAGDAQREWYAQMQAVNDRYLIPNLGFGVAAMALGLCLLIGGAALLKPKSWARTWVRRTFLVAIIFEILRQILYVVWQVELFPVMQRQFEVMVAPNGDSTGSPAMLKTMQTAIMLLSYGFGAIWFLTKLVAYIWGRRYLNGKIAKAYCVETSIPTPDVSGT